MPTILHTGPADLLHVRFAVSPLFETIGAVRVLSGVRDDGYRHVGWLEALEPDVATGLEELMALHKPRGYVPDFVSPPPQSARPSAQEQIAEVRRTPLERVRAELELGLRDQRDEGARARLRGLLENASDARERLARQLELAWARLLAARWPRLLAVLEADIAHRSGVLARRGLRGALAGLHPAVRATSRSVRLAHGDDDRELAGEGLLLMPSVFVWPDPVMVLDPPWQPSLIYPARGVADLWRALPLPVPGALGRLLGETRAGILTVLDEPASTTALARRLELSPANVSAHLGVLRAAGLVVSDRRGREVQYVLSALGGAVIAANRTD